MSISRATAKPTTPRQVRARLAEELADAATFLYKLAYQCGIDLEDALKANMSKAENRFSVDFGRADTERYLARQAENLARIQETRPDRSPSRG